MSVIEPNELIFLGEKILNSAESGEEIEIYLSYVSQNFLRVYKKEVEIFESAISAGAGIRVIRDSKQGFSHCGTLDVDILINTLYEARENAKYSLVDETLVIANPGARALEIDTYMASHLSADEKIRLALGLENGILRTDKRISQVEQTNLSDYELTTAVLNTKGIRAANKTSRANLSAVAIATDDEGSYTGYGYTWARNPESLDSDFVLDQAVKKSTRMLGAKKPKSTETVVVFEPEMTGTFLAIIAQALSAEALYQGTSMFKDHLNEQIAVKDFTLSENPTDGRYSHATPSDDEGVATKPVTLIENGILRAFMHNSQTAKRLGTVTNACAQRQSYSTLPTVGARAIGLEPGTKSNEEIISAVKDGVLITSLIGVHSGVNPVSGDFSVGAEGLLIKDGKLADSYKEFAIASNIQKMLHDIIYIGSDLYYGPGSARGQSIAIANTRLSGT
jgi:PmbA protein